MRIASQDNKNEQWVQAVPYQDLYKISDVSLIMGTGSPQIYTAIHRGTLKGYRLQGVTVVKHEDLVDYISRRTVVVVVSPELQEIRPRTSAIVTAPVSEDSQATAAAVLQEGAPLDIFGDEDTEDAEDDDADSV